MQTTPLHDSFLQSSWFTREPASAAAVRVVGATTATTWGSVAVVVVVVVVAVVVFEKFASLMIMILFDCLHFMKMEKYNFNCTNKNITPIISPMVTTEILT